MTGISVSAIGEAGKARPTPLTALQDAVSGQTRDFADSVVKIFQPARSPGALGLSAGRLPDYGSLEARLFDALAEAKILTSQVAMHLDQEWRSKLFQQLDSLHDAEEWELGDEPVQRASFETFLKAILSLRPARRPGLGLSNAGQLIAAWTKGADRLTIEFLSNGRVRWVLSRSYGADIERFAGETGVARLGDGLAVYHPEHWFSGADDNF